MSILIFNAGSAGRFAVPLLSVSEIIKRQAIQKFPGMSAFIDGVMDIRGRIVTVVDLPKLLLGADVSVPDASLVVLHKEEGDYALKVSAVDRIIKDTAGLKSQCNRMRKYTGEVLILDDGSLVQMVNLGNVLDASIKGRALR